GGNGAQNQSSLADEVKALREAMQQQQQQISQQQQQISQQQQQIQNLQQQAQDKSAGTPHVADASLTVSPAPVTAATNTSATGTAVVQETEKPKESPLSFRIGGTEFTPGGFVDFENVFRSTNTAGGITTPFGGIPYSNTVSGHLTEF